MADADPVREVFDAVVSGRAVPFAWAVEWTAAGTLDAAWRASDDPGAMLGLLALGAPRPRAVEVAVALARPYLRLLPRGEARPRAALDAAAAWARGEASARAAFDAGAAAVAAGREIFDRAARAASPGTPREPGSFVARAAANAAFLAWSGGGIVSPDPGRRGEAVGQRLVAAQSMARSSSVAAYDRAYARVARELRRLSGPPTVAAVLAAGGARG